MGSVIAVSDDAGAVMESFTYSPYGVAGGSSSGFPFRFTGQKLDPETGLYYYKARYYDPETGRFLQTDPIGYEDQMNLYAYVGNDPVNNTDPTGLECVTKDTTTCGNQDGNFVETDNSEQDSDSPGQDSTVGAARDFKRNYDDMRDANTIGADKYFHCKANCEATKRGPSGEASAKAISDAREATDQLKGGTAEDSAEDQEANRTGREGAKENPEQSCRATCDEYRPEGLDEEY